MSNGSDAVWNTCLYTAFTSGSVAFVDANGNLAQNNSRFHWDNSNRRLSLGNNLAQATLYLYDEDMDTPLNKKLAINRKEKTIKKITGRMISAD